MAALEVCDMTVNSVTEKFQFSGHLCASKLCLMEKFPQYCVEFPGNNFRTTIKIFPILNGLKLRTGLEVLHDHKDLCMYDLCIARGILYFLRTCDYFEDRVTILMKTVESERCFSTMRGIKTFYRNSMGTDKLNVVYRKK